MIYIMVQVSIYVLFISQYHYIIMLYPQCHIIVILYYHYDVLYVYCTYCCLVSLR